MLTPNRRPLTGANRVTLCGQEILRRKNGNHRSRRAPRGTTARQVSPLADITINKIQAITPARRAAEDYAGNVGSEVSMKKTALNTSFRSEIHATDSTCNG